MQRVVSLVRKLGLCLKSTFRLHDVFHTLQVNQSVCVLDAPAQYRTIQDDATAADLKMCVKASGDLAPVSAVWAL